jgi:hypothetical protein
MVILTVNFVVFHLLYRVLALKFMKKNGSQNALMKEACVQNFQSELLSGFCALL